MKLSAAQRGVLEEIASGTVLAWWHGINAHFHWHGNPERRAPNSRTVRKLEDLGLLKRESIDWRRSNFVITPAGRAALEADDAK